MVPAVKRAIQTSSLATLLGLVPHYAAFYFFGSPLWTETIAEWIMAHTPSHYAVPLLQTLGAWAKPFAVTGALASLGFLVFLALPLKWLGPALAAIGLAYVFQYHSWLGQVSFWLPVAWASARQPATPVVGRRRFLGSAVMTAGVFGVALESYAREQALARRATHPVALFPFQQPAERFGAGLVRKAVTPVPEFYGMSKNTVDPAIHPATWSLRITVDGREVKRFRYEELLALPRVERYVTLRCVSNTLKSDLMGTAAWSGIQLGQLMDRGALPPGIVEAAILGLDGHGDSLTLDYAYGGETLLALGMNGFTLDRTHGFPLRLLVPRYYGFKNVKWISEIAFVSRPYFGTWPKLGYTREPVIHIASHIDRIQKLGDSWKIAGVSFAGTRGIQAVDVRADEGPWIPAELEAPLSAYTWTRWIATVPGSAAKQIEARAQDSQGRWQESSEGPLFPDGVTGPTVRRLG